MAPKIVALNIVLAAATVLGAALPSTGDVSKQSVSTVNKRDFSINDEVWIGDENTTEEYSRATDDAWTHIKLEFPMKIFGKSDTNVYFSMNGLISLSKPGKGPALPPKKFPVGPASCGSSCIPENTIALLWQDLYLPPRKSGLGVQWVYHEPTTSAPHLGHHYHMFWTACQKGVPFGKPDFPEKPCGDATRSVQLNYYENRPGIFYLTWRYIPDDLKDSFVIGAQAYPKYLSAKYPGIWPDSDAACLILDTQKKTVTPEDPNKC
ncbi:hypothetical protein Dda_7430 [Drechslerella dactyloides]|uniref:Uncharacterized protein n=1 Tax=Drechslerella dactyloides TaxID=74499 RepID=A0AAD6IS49_DREDA|nr:hypothetical protein Dda_7430 [Drechslerella dactyloides]